MDAHELFIRFKDGHLPSTREIHSIFVLGELHRLELVALMYADRDEKINMDAVFAYNPKKCKALAENMLSALVVQNSTFGETMNEAGVQMSLAAFSNIAISKSVPDQKETMSSVHDNRVRNFAAECNDYFLHKSRSRIMTLVHDLGVESKMTWVRFVASRVECGEDYNRADFRLLSDTSLRHVHVSSSNICDFLQALTRDEVKTFSWDLAHKNVINLSKMRLALKNIASDPNTMVVILCSIGLPTFKLYNPVDFLKEWRSFRFKRVTNSNVVKTALRPLFSQIAMKNDLNDLLLQYSSKTLSVEESPRTVDLYMFKHWYSYPPASVLEQLVDSANAIIQRCQSI
tara:strand:+ start:5078 stop:6109 length:1032 start_codon:yes stop_codon:yes gene_type:complete